MNQSFAGKALQSLSLCEGVLQRGLSIAPKEKKSSPALFFKKRGSEPQKGDLELY